MRFLGKNMPKCVCGRGFTPDPAGGAYSTPSDPLTGFKGPTCKGKAGREGVGEEWEGKANERGRGKGREMVKLVILFPHFKPWRQSHNFHITKIVVVS